VKLSRALEAIAVPVVVTSLAAFLAVRLTGALVDWLLLPAPPIIFYEDLIGDLLLYAGLGLVAAVSIILAEAMVAVRVSPAGPALVLHLYALVARSPGRP
jgi:hypothetical protein